MTREEAIKSLGTGTSHERLKAARFLCQHAHSSDLPTLRSAHQTENVSYIKTSLKFAIDRLSNMAPAISPDPPDEPDIPPSVKRQIYNEAIEWISGLVLHEVASSIGLAKSFASREITDYEWSKTKGQLEVVERICEAIEQLKGAVAVPRPQSFDLAELLAEISDTEKGENETLEMSLHGIRPMLVTSDPALIRFGICNGIRNAIEAVVPTSSGRAHSIIITWGETDVDYWVSILDQGPGIIGSPEAAFTIGTSNKPGHSGFGLAIARKAMETLGGTVSLMPGAQGGTKYEARWPQ